MELTMAVKRKNARKETFSRFDPAEYLNTKADVAGYIEAVMEEGGDDPAVIAYALGVIARARGMAQISEETGLAREGLYRSLSADGNPSLDTLIKVLKALGLKLAVRAA
jgi:probable addiction module antidote protein